MHACNYCNKLYSEIKLIMKKCMFCLKQTFEPMLVCTDPEAKEERIFFFPTHPHQKQSFVFHSVYMVKEHQPSSKPWS